MTYLRPAIANFRLRQLLDTGLPIEGLGHEFAKLAIVGNCSPHDIASFIDGLESKKEPAVDSVTELRAQTAESVKRQVRQFGWMSLEKPQAERASLLEHETAAMRVLAAAPKTTRKTVFLMAVEGAKSLAPLPNALAVAEGLDLSAAEKARFKTQVIGLLREGHRHLSQAAIAALSKGHLCDGDEFLPARLRGVIATASAGLSEHEARAFVQRMEKDLSTVKGVYFTQQRELTQLEAYNTVCKSPLGGPDILALAARGYVSDGTLKGNASETRAFFTVLHEAAHLKRDAAAGDPDAPERLKKMANELGAAKSLRAFRATTLVEIAQQRAARVATTLARQTGKRPQTFAAGLEYVSPDTLGTAYDACLCRRNLDHYPDDGCDPKLPRDAIAEAIVAFAEGRFSEWKFSHRLAGHQLGHLEKETSALWREDHAWELPFAPPGGGHLRARESSDLRDLLYFADRPVVSCLSLLADGSNGYAGPSVIVDANKKVVLIEDDRGTILGRTLVRTAPDAEGKPLIVVERVYSPSNDNLFRNRLQAGVIAGLAKKHGDKTEICAGFCVADKQMAMPVNDALGFANGIIQSDLSLPASLSGYEYVDSSAGTDMVVSSDPARPKATVVKMALLRNAGQSPRLPEVAETVPSPSPFGPEERIISARRARLTASEKVMMRMFPDREQRQRFTEQFPACMPTGDVPNGSEPAWRDVVIQAPQAAQFLHHAAFATAYMRGKPDPKLAGEDFREAVAVAEAQPTFSGMLGGLSGKEISRLRESWVNGIREQVRSGPPGLWPPAVNLPFIIRALASEMRPDAKPFFEGIQGTLRPLRMPVISPRLGLS